MRWVILFVLISVLVTFGIHKSRSNPEKVAQSKSAIDESLTSLVFQVLEDAVGFPKENIRSDSRLVQDLGVLPIDTLHIESLISERCELQVADEKLSLFLFPEGKLDQMTVLDLTTNVEGLLSDLDSGTP